MTRVQIRNKVNKILQAETKGLHRDNYWRPIYSAFDKIRYEGFVLYIQNTRYGHTDIGVPNEKVWLFEIVVPGSKKPLYGVATAHGAGTVLDPLDVYDVSAYVS